MKTFNTLLLSFALVATSCATALAGGTDSATATQSPAKAKRSLTAFAHKAYMSTTRPGTLWLITLKAEAKPVRVAIQDMDGETLSTFNVYQDRLMQAVDCSQLPAGAYKVVLQRGTQLETDTFEVK